MNLKESFNTSLSIFVLPLLIGVISFVMTRVSEGWPAIAYAVWIVVALIAIVFAALFLLLNRYLFKLSLNWWKNVLISLGLWFLSMGLLVLLSRF